jgi:hypothetical protein
LAFIAERYFLIVI